VNILSTHVIAGIGGDSARLNLFQVHLASTVVEIMHKLYLTELGFFDKNETWQPNFVLLQSLLSHQLTSLQ
jgi:hypothetical protein